MGQEASPKQARGSGDPLPQDILTQLDSVLSSPPFRTSKRCSDLLRHVVRAASEGNVEFLKERTLGVAVFNREPDYDTNQDPVVRNTAGQVRKRLAQYYCEIGRERELRIDLPAGAYVPQIYQPAERAATVSTPAEESVPDVEPVKSSGKAKTIAISAFLTFLVLASIIGSVFLISRPQPTDLSLFWAPMLKQPDEVVLCVGQGHTYKLKGDRDRLFEGEAESGDPSLAPAGTIPLSDITPTWDRSIGIHDAQTLVRLTALFASFGKQVEFRGGRSTSLSDLRGKSTVLIGAFNNSWTLSLTGELRFYFDDDARTNTFLVRDRLHPENRDWEVRGDQQPARDHIDYAIVSRVFDPTTEQPVIVAAGIQGGGTTAAGELLTNAGYLAQALKNAPKHWEKRSLQFVLKTRLLGGTPGPPEVIASNYW